MYRSPSLRVAVLVKTNDGAHWILPQADELRRRGHDVVVVLPPGPGTLRSQLIDHGIDAADSPFDFTFRPNLATVRGLWRLRRLIRRLRPDVLHHHLYASALAARISTVGLRLRRVYMAAGPLYLESTVVRAVERLLWRMDDVVICCTEHLSGMYGRLGCPPERRPTAQYGIDVGYFTPPPLALGPAGPEAARAERQAKARATVGLNETDFVAVMVAWVYPPKRIVHNGRDFKGHDVLLEAWRTFHARHPRSHLLMIGDGFTDAGKQHRQELLRRFDVDADPSVTWLGWVEDLRPYFTAADVNVTPSLSEGSNGVVREASAMGLPSIVSEAGGLPEAIDDTVGWVTPCDDPAALAAALASAHEEHTDGRLAARGDRARDRAERCFDRGLAAQRVADIVEDAAGGVVRR